MPTAPTAARIAEMRLTARPTCAVVNFRAVRVIAALSSAHASPAHTSGAGAPCARHQRASA